MKPWLLLALILGCTSLPGHAEQVEFLAVFVASPMPIQTGAVRFSPQPGLVTTLNPAAQKTLLADLGQSTPAPDLLTLPGRITDSRIKVVLRPQALFSIDAPSVEPVVITAPISTDAAAPLHLPPAHTDQLRLQTLVSTELPIGDWALIYLGKAPSETDLPRYLYALVSTRTVK